MTRYVIVGAGAIGGTLGGRLAQHGVSTVLVARGDHGRALVSQGLRLRTPDDDLLIPVDAATDPAQVELQADDVLVFATKTHQVIEALNQWTDRPVYRDGELIGTAGETLPALTALNGVASEEMALRYFRRVFGVCIWLPAVLLTPGEIILRISPDSGIFHVGRYPAALADDADAALLDTIEADWTSATFGVGRPAEVMEWKYRKLIGNIGNVFQALVGTNGDYAPLVKAAQTEALELFDRVGIAYTSDEVERDARKASSGVRPVPGEPSEMGGSSWQSLARGTGSIETDYLNGEIALIARKHGLSAPINTIVASLGRVAAATGQAPGSISADELRVALGL